jgi:hypothetical protein
VVDGQSFNEVLSELKACRIDHELERKRYIVIKGDTTKTQDAALKVMFSVSCCRVNFEIRSRNAMKAFNRVLFVVSHSGTFSWRNRTVVRMAYEDRFVVTEKQTNGLDKWMEKGEKKENGEEGDTTTEEEDWDSYDIYYDYD